MMEWAPPRSASRLQRDASGAAVDNQVKPSREGQSKWVLIRGRGVLGTVRRTRLPDAGREELVPHRIVRAVSPRT